MKNYLKVILSYLLVFTSGPTFAQTSNKVAEFNRVEGAAVYESYAQNSSFDSNTLGCTAISGSAPTITTTLALIGKGSIQFSGSANTDSWRCRTKAFPTIVNASKQQGAGLNGQNCQIKFIYSSAYGGPVTQSEFTAYVANSSGANISGTSTLTSTYNIANPQQGRTALFFFPCPYNATAANAYVDLIINHTTGTSSSLVMDSFEPTYAKDIGQGVPNNVFSAKVSSAGVVSDLNQPGWIANATISDTSLFTFNVSGASVTQPLSCTATTNTGASFDAGNISVRKEGTQTATSLIYRTGFTNSGNLNFTKTAYAFDLNCTKAGSDFIQPTITPNNWNFNSRPWTLVTQGFGTTTQSGVCDYSRVGPQLYGRCVFTTGTTTAVAARIYLPAGLKGSTKYVTNPVQVGTISRKTAAASTRKRAVLTAFAGDDFLVVSNDDYTTAADPFTPITGSGWAGNSEIQSIEFNLEVQDNGVNWTENQNAPQLIGSVTSNASGALRTEYAVVDTVCTTTPCTISRSSGGFSSITRTSTGNYVANFSATWPTAPACFWNIANPNGNATTAIRPDGESTSLAQAYSWTTSGNSTLDVGFKIFCIGPR